MLGCGMWLISQPGSCLRYVGDIPRLSNNVGTTIYGIAAPGLTPPQRKVARDIALLDENCLTEQEYRKPSLWNFTTVYPGINASFNQPPLRGASRSCQHSRPGLCKCNRPPVPFMTLHNPLRMAKSRYTSGGHNAQETKDEWINWVG